ncbi:MAG: SDR family oxidoreductase [Dehalococcoidia bacterium]|nr:MAG: SDR family oxidoreductase [Dehalococcoidia bacterium]
MGGRICMVTGASSGIGKATALELARLGATVILVCRDRSKGESVIDEIRRKYSDVNVDLLLADLLSLDSVSAAANQYLEKYEHLHVLVNNAGAFFMKRRVTADGIESSFAVNYLSHFLLTNLLLDVLKQSAPARIVNMTGSHHSKATINFDDLQLERHYSGSHAIAHSKLAEILFTYELARRLEGTGVTANCLHPGVVATEFVDKAEDFPSAIKYIYRLAKPFMKSPLKGAETVIYLATSPEAEGVTGKYYVNKKAIESSPESYDTAVAESLWDVSLALTGLDTQ